MKISAQIRQQIDQLIYNQLYAPDYPTEDQTNLESEEKLIRKWVEESIRDAARAEDVGDWLRLGAAHIEAAFEGFRNHDNTRARRELEAAIEFLRNAASRKPFKVGFIGKEDGANKRIGDP
jgi:hypothetical protein